MVDKARAILLAPVMVDYRFRGYPCMFSMEDCNQPYKDDRVAGATKSRA